MSKFPFVSRVELIRSKLSNFSAHVSGFTVARPIATLGDPHGSAIRKGGTKTLLCKAYC